MGALHDYTTRETPQSEAIPGSDQVENSAGGYSFVVDDWARLSRFLMLGTEGGSYYASQRALTKDNAEVVARCLKADYERTVSTIVDVSHKGRAPKNDPALFALAMASAADTVEARRHALAMLPLVARTGMHLFQFVRFAEQFRGRGRAFNRALGEWYLAKDPDRLAYQVVKYRSRRTSEKGAPISHRDVLRLAKPSLDIRPVAGDEWESRRRREMDAVLAFAADHYDRDRHDADTPRVILDWLSAQASGSAAVTAMTVAQSEGRLSWEMLRSEHLADPLVWRTLLPSMPLGALTRNLARMTAVGTFDDPGSVATVEARLADREAIMNARLHPLAILVAQRIYAQGRGMRGSLSWAPNGRIVDSLTDAFHLAFGTVEPAGKRTLLALDVSGSMTWDTICGSPLMPRDASAALALVTLRTEPVCDVVTFSAVRGSWNDPAVTPLALSPRMRLDSAIKAVSNLPATGTDCALPMLYAADAGKSYDHFVVYTDSETWAGQIHPKQALDRYRQRTGIPAKLTVVGMVSNGFSIADPDDPGMLDVVGVDTATPQLINDFAAGRI